MTRIIQVSADIPEGDRIRDAAAVLRRGGLVAFPTETVYGLGANALDPSAVARIFAAKDRPANDPLIVHLAGIDQLQAVAAHVPAIVGELARRFWPGALTVIVQRNASVPDNVTAGLPTVAVRVPSHPIAHELIRVAGIPVAAPSANRFSRPSPTRAEHVLTDLEGRVDVVIDGGPTPIGVESTILDLTVSPPAIRRPGGVSLQQIRGVIPEVRVMAHTLASDVAQPSPGQLLRHYAPRASLTVFAGETDLITEHAAAAVRSNVAAGRRVGVLGPEEDLLALAPRLAAIGAGGRVAVVKCGSRKDREAAARELFQALRSLDAQAMDVIIATTPEGEGIDRAILDRLTRAAEGRVVFPGRRPVERRDPE